MGKGLDATGLVCMGLFLCCLVVAAVVMLVSG